ncbi:MAG: YciI family protein, partial [Actinomycetota bacterium]|nr:YciI family protein [Actinomycetota bacterium]
RECDVKYMIMMFGSAAGMMETQSREWILEMIEFMHQLDSDLREAGELVSSDGLADGTQAKTVTFQNGTTVVTDGPFAESKESVIGFWIVDVESAARAVEIASRVVAFTHGPIEVRQVMDAPPEV